MTQESPAVANDSDSVSLGPIPYIPEYEVVRRRNSAGSTVEPWSPAVLLEIHINADSDFTRKGWGAKVKALDGTYSEARGGAIRRFVHLPWPQGRELADQISVAFKGRVFIFRGGLRCPDTLASVVYSSNNHRDWPLRMGAAEAVYLRAITAAEADGDLVRVEQDPALRADELAWRENREAVAAVEATEAQIRRLQEALTEARNQLSENRWRIVSTAEAAERHTRRISAEVTPEATE